MKRLALLFFLSGGAALIVETTWLRWFASLFGASAPAASATLVAFFAGQGLGAAWASRRVAGWRVPLRVYGLLEVCAACGALAVPWILYAGEAVGAAGYDALREHPALLASLRFALALVATLPAAMAFGATLPAVGAAGIAHASALGRRGSALYAWNTAGAALGTALAAFFLPDAVGVRGTYAVGVGLGVCVGVGALALARRAPEQPPQPPGRAPAPPVRLSDGGPLAFAAFSGFLALSAQVLLVHAFAQVLNQSVYAFGSVLVVVLATLALGAAAVSALAARPAPGPERLLGLALALGCVAWLAFPAGFYAATGGLAYVGTSQPWPGYLGASLGLVALTAAVPLFLAALLLPATFAVAGRRAAPGASAGRLLGRMAAANTVGAIAGALAAPWVLLPAFGLFGAFAALAGLVGLAALLAPGRGDLPLRAGILTLGVGAVLLAASPLAHAPLRLEPGESVVAARSTPAGLVAVVRRPDGLLIRTDNHYALGGSAERVHEERQGHLPLLLHPAPRRVAYVGTATGISAGAATAHAPEAIYLVEIVPAVSRAAARHFGPFNRRVYEHPASRVVLDDARNFLRSTRARFDVVVADLFVPWRSGTGSLYTREHFRAVRSRLRPDGLFCQWLPLYQLDQEEFQIIARTFLDVFPDTAVFRGDFYGRFPIAALVGFAGRPASAAAVSAGARHLGAAGEADRWIADPLGPWALYVGALGPLAAELAEHPPNTDDRPRIQYRAARAHGGESGRREPFVGLAFARLGERLRRLDAAAGRPLYPDLPAAAARASEGGSLLQLGGALYALGRDAEAGQALAAAAARLPARLFAEAPADPSAAEVWHTGGP